MTFPPFPSFSLASLAVSGHLLLQVGSVFPLMWHLETSLLVAYLTYSVFTEFELPGTAAIIDTISAADGRKRSSFPRASIGKSFRRPSWGAEAQVRTLTTGCEFHAALPYGCHTYIADVCFAVLTARALPMVAQIQAITLMLLICIAKWTTMGSKPFYQSRQGKLSCAPIWLWHAHEIQRTIIMHDPHSRESRGFGFVTMETTEEAEATITQLYRCYGPNNQWKKWATPKSPISYMSDILGLWWTGSARTPTPGHLLRASKRNKRDSVSTLMYNW